MTVTLQDVDPAKMDNINVTTQGGTMIYEDTTFVNESYGPASSNMFASSMSVDYYLTMSTEIQNSNADSVNGNSAEWHESGAESYQGNRIYAEANAPSILTTPGFGVGVAAVAMLLAAFLFARR